MTNIEDAAHFESLRHKFEGKTNGARFLRDYSILKAFEEGMRQKEIGNHLGLSESRVKKIIGELKRLKNKP